MKRHLDSSMAASWSSTTTRRSTGTSRRSCARAPPWTRPCPRRSSILFGDGRPWPLLRLSSCSSRCRAAGRGPRRAGAARRRNRSRWPSSTCACRPGWDGLETIEKLWAVDSGRAGRHLLGALRLRLGRLHRAARPLRQTTRPQEAVRADRGPAMRERADAQVAGRAARCAARCRPSSTWSPCAPQDSKPRIASCGTWPPTMRSPACRTACCSTTACRRPSCTRSAASSRFAVAGARSRPLQAHQRFARPSRRRRVAEPDGARGCAASCATSTPWRASAATNSCSCCRSVTARDAARSRAARHRRAAGARRGSPAWTCTSPRASASPSSRRTARPRRACSRTPTPRCTAPSSAAATTCSASSPAWTAPRASA